MQIVPIQLKQNTGLHSSASQARAARFQGKKPSVVTGPITLSDHDALNYSYDSKIPQLGAKILATVADLEQKYHQKYYQKTGIKGFLYRRYLDMTDFKGIPFFRLFDEIREKTAPHNLSDSALADGTQALLTRNLLKTNGYASFYVTDRGREALELIHPLDTSDRIVFNATFGTDVQRLGFKVLQAVGKITQQNIEQYNGRKGPLGALYRTVRSPQQTIPFSDILFETQVATLDRTTSTVKMNQAIYEGLKTLEQKNLVRCSFDGYQLTARGKMALENPSETLF